MNLKTIRLSKNMTQEDLADALGVKRSCVSMWENNCSFPRKETLLKMTEIFNCSIDDLVKEI